jgi:hypothetical protein
VRFSSDRFIFLNVLINHNRSISWSKIVLSGVQSFQNTYYIPYCSLKNIDPPMERETLFYADSTSPGHAKTFNRYK